LFEALIRPPAWAATELSSILLQMALPRKWLCSLG
jgi:hypothetical protein